MKFLTGNTHKFSEASQIFPGLEQLDLDLPEIQEVDPQKVVAAKLAVAREQSSDVLFVDDVSLMLDCISPLPGPLVKLFLQTIGPRGLYELCERYQAYGCTLKDTIGLSIPGKEQIYFEGVAKGTIVAPRVESKMGIDAIFQPLGYEVTFAEMTMEEKNAISHRRLALEKLKDYLEKNPVE